MKFEQLYSSSSGNLYMVTASNGKRLMIECGVPWPKLQKALNYDLSNIVGCLLSHEHKDHSKAALNVMEAGIDVFASAGTFEALGITEATPFSRRAKFVKDMDVVRLSDDFKVRVFGTNHDAAEPLGFVVKSGDEHLLFATDTSYIKQRFSHIAFDIIALGCSYDIDILKQRVDTNDINEEVAKRLLSSHAEKQEVMRYLDEFVDLSKCREIHLLHCSATNLDIAATKTEFEMKFFIETIVRKESHNGKVKEGS